MNEDGYIKLWRRVPHQETRVLQPVQCNSTFGNNLILVLPGADTEHSFERSIRSYINDVERLLGKRILHKSPVPDILVASYSNAERTLEQTPRTNADPFYRDPHIQHIVDTLIIPAFRKNIKITLLGYSAGTVAIENIRRCLLHSMHQEGYSDAMIKRRIQEIAAISVGNVSETYSLTPHDRGPLFTSLIVNSMDDEVSKRRNPKFADLIPESHQNGNISINNVAENALLLTTHTRASTGWHRNPDYILKASESAIDQFAFPVGHHSAEGYRGHNKEHYWIRNHGTPLGTVWAVEHALRNAVQRTNLEIPVNELLAAPQLTMHPHGATGMASLEELTVRFAMPRSKSPYR